MAALSAEPHDVESHAVGLRVLRESRRGRSYHPRGARSLSKDGVPPTTTGERGLTGASITLTRVFCLQQGSLQTNEFVCGDDATDTLSYIMLCYITI